MRPGLVRFLRILAALVVAGIVFYRIGPARILSELRNVDLPWFMATLAALLAGASIRIFNWRGLMVRLGGTRPVPYWRMACCYYAGGMLGYTLPSTAGTDALRSLLAHRNFGGRLTHYAAVAVTLAGATFFSTALLGLTGAALLGPGYWSMPIVQLAAAICAAMIAGLSVLYVMLHYQRPLLAGVFRSMPRWSFRIRSKLRRFVNALRLSDERGGGWRETMCCSIAASFALSLAFAASGRAAGLDIDVRVWMTLLPLTSLGAFIPASISGFGFDQALMIYLLAPHGVSAETAFAVSALIALSWIVIYCTIGIAAFAVLSRRRQS